MLREAALALFLVAVALGLWLAEVRPLAVVFVMALALAVAWVIEWISWREKRLQDLRPVREEIGATEVGAEPPPPPAPAPRARDLWLRRPRRRSELSEAAGASPAPPDSKTPGEHEVETEQPMSEEAHSAGPPPAEQPMPQEPRPEESPPSERRLKPVQSSPVPPPPPEPEPSLPPPQPEPEGAPVVPLWARSSQPREWNLWDLERIARAQSRRDPERFEEWSYLFLHLRGFANADGVLPAEFDGLVRDSFGGLLEPAQGA